MAYGLFSDLQTSFHANTAFEFLFIPYRFKKALGATKTNEVEKNDSNVIDSCVTYLLQIDRKFEMRYYDMKEKEVCEAHHFTKVNLLIQGGNMRFDEKLDLVLKTLEIKNTDLAHHVGIDASLVSRLRKGKRKKPSDIKRIKDLSSAIAELGTKKISSSKLPLELTRKLKGASSDGKGFEEALFVWFEEDSSAQKPSTSSLTLRLFGEKLSALLGITDATNVQIARALNVDSSLISLYRNGVRFPADQNTTLSAISAFFARQNLNNQQREALLNVIEYDSDSLDEESLQNAIFVWLSMASGTPPSSEGVESFLERVDNFGDFAAGRTVIPLEEIMKLAPAGNKPAILFDHKGIQQAAITYLAHVATQKQTRTLHHFSDQSTDWMLGNSEYAKIWASLMVHVLSRGNTLRIIHTVNRDSSILFSAMENWIPLYMIGEIVPYYFRTGTSGRFHSSHFLAEDLALISGYCAPNRENRAVYRYDTDPQILLRAKEQFEGLLAQCGELMSIYKGKKDAKSYEIHLNAFWGHKGNATSLIPRLSLATIPKDLLQSKLEKQQLDTKTVHTILDNQAKQERAFRTQLNNGNLTELYMLESADSVQGGNVYYDIASELTAEPIAYTAEEYEIHLEHIYRLEKESSGYQLFTLEHSPFRNIKIHSKENGRTIVEKLSEPVVAFSFNNPHMCRGISHFLHELSYP